jgi:hypothetical protein
VILNRAGLSMEACSMQRRDEMCIYKYLEEEKERKETLGGF